MKSVLVLAKKKSLVFLIIESTLVYFFTSVSNGVQSGLSSFLRGYIIVVLQEGLSPVFLLNNMHFLFSCLNSSCVCYIEKHLKYHSWLLFLFLPLQKHFNHFSSLFSTYLSSILACFLCNVQVYPTLPRKESIRSINPT